MENSLGCLLQSQQVLTSLYFLLLNKIQPPQVFEEGKVEVVRWKKCRRELKKNKIIDRDDWKKFIIKHLLICPKTRKWHVSIYSSTHPSISLYPCGAACIEVSFKGIQLGIKIPLSDIRPRTQGFKLGRGELHIISCSFCLFNHRRRKVLHNQSRRGTQQKPRGIIHNKSINHWVFSSNCANMTKCCFPTVLLYFE